MGKGACGPGPLASPRAECPSSPGGRGPEPRACPCLRAPKDSLAVRAAPTSQPRAPTCARPGAPRCSPGPSGSLSECHLQPHHGRSLETRFWLQVWSVRFSLVFVCSQGTFVVAAEWNVASGLPRVPLFSAHSGCSSSSLVLREGPRPVGHCQCVCRHRPSIRDVRGNWNSTALSQPLSCLHAGMPQGSSLGCFLSYLPLPHNCPLCDAIHPGAWLSIANLRPSPAAAHLGCLKEPVQPSTSHPGRAFLHTGHSANCPSCLRLCTSPSWCQWAKKGVILDSDTLLQILKWVWWVHLQSISGWVGAFCFGFLLSPLPSWEPNVLPSAFQELLPS